MNTLFPVFLKAEQMTILIVGGGNVGLEKLEALLKNAPLTNIVLVAPEIKTEIVELQKTHRIELIYEPYHSAFLESKNIVIVGTDKPEVNKQVQIDCKSEGILVNVADTPDLCDFYLGGVVTKGHVKIAISTNGKSPTTAKRIRQFLEDVIPENINDLVQNLNEFRKSIKGDFEQKVEIMNEMTKEFIKKK